MSDPVGILFCCGTGSGTGGLPYPGGFTEHVEYTVEIPNSEQWGEIIGNFGPAARYLNLPVSQSITGSTATSWNAFYVDNPLKPGIWHLSAKQSVKDRVTNVFIAAMRSLFPPPAEYSANDSFDTVAQVDSGPFGLNQTAFVQKPFSNIADVTYEQDFQVFSDVPIFSGTAGPCGGGGATYLPKSLGIGRSSGLDFSTFALIGVVYYSWTLHLKLDFLHDAPP